MLHRYGPRIPFPPRCFFLGETADPFLSCFRGSQRAADFWIVRASLVAKILGIVGVGLAPRGGYHVLALAGYSLGSALTDALRSCVTDALPDRNLYEPFSPGYRSTRRTWLAGERSIDREARHREQLGQIPDRILARVVHPAHLALLFLRELRLLAAQLAPGPGDRHPLAGAQAYQVAVTDPKRVEEVVAEIVKDFGKLDVFVANAGMANSKPVLDMSIEEYRQLMGVNGGYSKMWER